MQRRHLAAALALALPLFAGCKGNEPLNAPDLTNNDALFQRYVSMGNSITAGFQSGGINDSTQLQAYPVIVARQAGASNAFFVPLLNKPGCPAPYVVNSTVPPTRLSATPCGLRNPQQMPFVSNVAVPGLRAADLLSNDAGGANQLSQFILGGLTEVQAMRRADPTFVSLWIGNNDVLGSLTSLPQTYGGTPAGNPGNPSLVTPVADFQAAYGHIVDSIAAAKPKGAILVGVADVSAIPYSTPGSVWFCLKNGCGATLPANPILQANPRFQVLPNCAPAAAVPGAQGDATLVPFPVGFGKLNAALAGPSVQILDCTADLEVVTPGELQVLRGAITGYNDFIKAQAAAHDWAYFDPNPVLLAAKAEPFPAAPAFPKVTTFPCFPQIPGVTTNGGPCGNGLNKTPNILFGTWFSLDGVHPSAVAHRVIADSIISTINAKYATTIPFAGPGT